MSRPVWGISSPTPERAKMCRYGSRRSRSPPPWPRYLAPRTFSRGNPIICVRRRGLPTTPSPLPRARAVCTVQALPDVLPTCSPAGIRVQGASGEHGGFEAKLSDFRLLHCVLAGIHPATMHQRKLIFWGRKGDVATSRGKGLSRSRQKRTLHATGALLYAPRILCSVLGPSLQEGC